MTAEHDALRARLEELSTDELSAIFSRRNSDEWRPEVFDIVRTILAGRGVFAVPPSRADVDDDSPEVSGVALPPEGATPIATGFDLGEADDADKILSAAGIPVQVLQTSSYGFYVYVPDGYEKPATELLRDAGLLPAEDGPGPITQIGGPCPACGGHVPPDVGECPTCGLAV